MTVCFSLARSSLPAVHVCKNLIFMYKDLTIVQEFPQKLTWYTSNQFVHSTEKRECGVVNLEHAYTFRNSTYP